MDTTTQPVRVAATPNDTDGAVHLEYRHDTIMVTVVDNARSGNTATSTLFTHQQAVELAAALLQGVVTK